MRKERENNLIKGKMDKLAKDILQLAELTLKDTADDKMWNTFRTMTLDKINETRRSIGQKYYSYDFDLKRGEK